MALQESLNRFNKQQEKSLSMRATLQARAPPSQNLFTNDIERLQLINRIRNSPDGAQIKRVLDLLLQRRQFFSAQQINDACYVDVASNKSVFDSLTNNPKVNFDGTHFSYKAEHNVNNKEQLVPLLKEFCEGVSVSELEDSYPTVMDDLQALKDSREIRMITGEGKETIVYYDALPDLISVDDELKMLFREVKVPEDMIVIEKELKKNKMVPATDTVKRRTAAAHVYGTDARLKPKKKERRLSRKVKLTNAYLPEFVQQFYY